MPHTRMHAWAHTHTHTQVHAVRTQSQELRGDINRSTQKMKLKSKTHSIPQAHVLCLTPLSPSDPPHSNLSASSNGSHACMQEEAVLLIGLLLLSDILN